MSAFISLPVGSIATVVTHLEMTRLPPSDTGALARRDLATESLTGVGAATYKALFAAVGAEWLWFSRLRASDAEVAAVLADPGIEILGLRAADRGNNLIGLLELDWRQSETVEVAFLGVVPSHLGMGGGRFLLAHAIERARQAGVARIWLHTCTFDHPDALAFYQRAGFRPFKREIEVTEDPRLDGTLPRSAAPHVPLIGAGTSF